MPDPKLMTKFEQGCVRFGCLLVLPAGLAVLMSTPVIGIAAVMFSTITSWYRGGQSSQYGVWSTAYLVGIMVLVALVITAMQYTTPQIAVVVTGALTGWIAPVGHEMR